MILSKKYHFCGEKHAFLMYKHPYILVFSLSNSGKENNTSSPPPPKKIAKKKHNIHTCQKNSQKTQVTLKILGTTTARFITILLVVQL